MVIPVSRILSMYPTTIVSFLLESFAGRTGTERRLIRLAYRSRSRAITTRWISLVPS
jgi:hypothetical protein